MRFSEVPRLSSNQICRALERLGCTRARAAAGSHQAYRRQGVDGRTRTIPVVLGKTQVPKGTLRSILLALDLSLDDFLADCR